MRFSIGLTLICTTALLNAGGAGKEFKQTANEVKVFDLTNQERKKKEVPALKLSPVLCKIARAHSENMARQQKLEHVLDDKGPLDRMRAAGYKFQRGAENIAQGDEDFSIQDVLKLWMESKDHAANILHDGHSEIGIGIARDKSGQVYYTQVFARPKN